jgi:hypothetical protein
LALAGEVTDAVAAGRFSTPVLLLIADGALVASMGEDASGYWSADPLMRSLVLAAISALTG